MSIEEEDLAGIRNICIEYYEDKEPNIRSIILYSEAAREYVG